jgi:outer membrane protein assembly factor BamD
MNKKGFVKGLFYFCGVLKRINIFLFFVAMFAISSCSEYNRIIKSDDLQLKYDKAIEFYDGEEYGKAYPLLEELIIIYRGTGKSELLSYYFANCDFYTKDYTLAAYRYKNFTSTFPTSQYAEECKFRSALCLYLNSPKYSLDQTSTYQALQELQMFTNQYSESGYIDSCNLLIDDLRWKLETKSFENAKQYHHTRSYKAAITAFENLDNDFPASQYKEESYFLHFISSYNLAINSIPTKKLERLDGSIKSYVKFVDSFPQSDFVKEAEATYESVLKEKVKLSENKKS